MIRVAIVIGVAAAVLSVAVTVAIVLAAYTAANTRTEPVPATEHDARECQRHDEDSLVEDILTRIEAANPEFVTQFNQTADRATSGRIRWIGH